jgi:6-phosphogluconolactonase (cycloisomerase 2 family)
MYQTIKRTAGQYLCNIGLALSLLAAGTSVYADRDSGAVYAMTNAANGNEIVVYDRDSKGHLSFAGQYPTGGLGTGGAAPFEPVDALGSQGSLLLSKDNRLLFAVNAISNTISVFRVERHDNSLALIDQVDSGGDFPVSLTLHGDLLYVLNSGGEGNITGFTLDGDGNLTPIQDSTRTLDAGGDNPPFFLVSPAQIGFDPWGEHLLVTVKGSDSIHLFAIDEAGKPSQQPVTTISNGSTPFGFAFGRRGQLLVAEAFGTGSVGEPNVSAVSSYAIFDGGELEVISPSVANFQTASCWLTTNPGGRFAYTTNNASDTLSGYRVGKNGSLALLEDDGVSGHTGHAPVDLAMTDNGRFLYVLNAGSGSISMYRVKKFNGRLTSLGEIGGLPVENGSVGIAVR